MAKVKLQRVLVEMDADPDLYLRVVRRTADHIVVLGAKAHQTGALSSHEIIVMPAGRTPTSATSTTSPSTAATPSSPGTRP